MINAAVAAKRRFVDAPSSTILSIQLLRAVAAVMLVTFHVRLIGAVAVDAEGILNSGVDLFF